MMGTQVYFDGLPEDADYELIESEFVKVHDEPHGIIRDKYTPKNGFMVYGHWKPSHGYETEKQLKEILDRLGYKGYESYVSY